MQQVKFLDIQASYPQIKAVILEKIQGIVETGQFIDGQYTEEFERAFAEYCSVKHCIAVNNGTSALMLSLWAHGIGPGDEVILPVNTFIATAEAVSFVGATPVFVDIDPNTYLLDPTAVAQAQTERTRAIIAVHLYGQCVDMDEITAIARERGILVIEDACQAHGALYGEKRAGSLGDIAAFSFYPGKNLGAWGEAGAVTTNDDIIAQKIRELKSHGEVKKYHHNRVGGNFRMEEFQAAVLGVKLRYLDEWNERRRMNASVYLDALVGTELKLPQVAGRNTPVWHLFVVQVEKRDVLRERLQALGIHTAIHYPYPLHLASAYAGLGYCQGDFPKSEYVQQRIVSLPMYPELTVEQILYVTHTLKELL